MRPLQLLSSLVAVSLVVDAVAGDLMGPNVQRQSRVRLRRPATGVSGHVSLSSSEDDESRLSPVRGCLGRGELSSDEKVADGMINSDFGCFETSSFEGAELKDPSVVEEFESDDSVDASVDRVELED